LLVCNWISIGILLTQKRKKASKQTNKQTSEKEHFYLKIWDEIRIVKTDPNQKNLVEN